MLSLSTVAFLYLLGSYTLFLVMPIFLVGKARSVLTPGVALGAITLTSLVGLSFWSVFAAGSQQHQFLFGVVLGCILYDIVAIVSKINRSPQTRTYTNSRCVFMMVEAAFLMWAAIVLYM